MRTAREHNENHALSSAPYSALNNNEVIDVEAEIQQTEELTKLLAEVRSKDKKPEVITQFLETTYSTAQAYNNSIGNHTPITQTPTDTPVITPRSSDLTVGEVFDSTRDELINRRLNALIVNKKINLEKDKLAIENYKSLSYEKKMEILKQNNAITETERI